VERDTDFFCIEGCIGAGEWSLQGRADFYKLEMALWALLQFVPVKPAKNDSCAICEPDWGSVSSAYCNGERAISANPKGEPKA
jgi:hypothetical protein